MSFFTEANRTRAKEIVARYPRAKSAILPLAHLAQDQHGWLSAEAMTEIGELTGVTAGGTLTANETTSQEPNIATSGINSNRDVAAALNFSLN